MGETVQIEVLNWNKYNPRKDYHTHWFRLEDDLLDNPEFCDFSCQDFMTMFTIFCVTSQRQGKPWTFSVNWLAAKARLKPSEVKLGLEKLQEKHIVRISNGTRSVSDTKPNVHNEQYITNERTNSVGEISTKSPASPGKGTSLLIAEFFKAWKSKSDVRPHFGGKEQGILRRLAKDMSPEQFSELFQIYLQMKDPWFEKKGYDLATFEQNLHKISVSAQKGHEINDPIAQAKVAYERSRKQLENLP